MNKCVCEREQARALALTAFFNNSVLWKDTIKQDRRTAGLPPTAHTLAHGPEHILLWLPNILFNSPGQDPSLLIRLWAHTCTHTEYFLLIQIISKNQFTRPGHSFLWEENYTATRGLSDNDTSNINKWVSKEMTGLIIWSVFLQLNITGILLRPL